jgi:hypothetical protein
VPVPRRAPQRSPQGKLNPASGYWECPRTVAAPKVAEVDPGVARAPASTPSIPLGVVPARASSAALVQPSWGCFQAAGRTLRAIADALNFDGVPTGHGGVHGEHLAAQQWRCRCRRDRPTAGVPSWRSVRRGGDNRVVDDASCGRSLLRPAHAMTSFWLAVFGVVGGGCVVLRRDVRAAVCVRSRDGAAGRADLRPFFARSRASRLVSNPRSVGSVAGWGCFWVPSRAWWRSRKRAWWGWQGLLGLWRVAVRAAKLRIERPMSWGGRCVGSCDQIEPRRRNGTD